MQCAIHGSGVNLYQLLQLVSSICNMAIVDFMIFQAHPGSHSIVITEMGHDDMTFD